MRKIMFVLVLGSTLVLPTILMAKSTEDRIRALEQQLDALQRTYMDNNKNTASAVARAGALQEEWGTIKGQLDANQHLIRTQHDDLTRRIEGLDHRIQSIEDRMEIFSSQLSKALGKVAPKTAAEGDLYQKGLDLVNKAQYLEAAAAFESFIKQYGRSEFAASAQAWIGECFYSMRDYRRAIKEYQEFIEKYPRDKNVSTAVLKQGNSFYELGMLDEAKAFYQKVLQSYPSSSAAELARAKLERIKERESKPNAPTQGTDGFGSYPSETLQQKQTRLRGEVPPQQETAESPPKQQPQGFPVRDF